MGRGPVETRAYIIEDMILVRLRGVLTPAEVKLAQSPDGHALIEQLRRQLLEGSRPLLEEIVQKATDSGLVSLHTDISVKTSERVIVFTLTQNLEERFGWGKREKSSVVLLAGLFDRDGALHPKNLLQARPGQIICERRARHQLAALNPAVAGVHRLRPGEGLRYDIRFAETKAGYRPAFQDGCL